LICLISPSLEVWLTLEDAQFCLTVCVAMILLSDAKRHRWIRSFTLLLAGLTGPVSCAFLPFLWVRALQQKTRAVWAQAVILTACTAVQVWVLTHALRSGERALVSLEKLRWLGPVFLLKTLVTVFATRLSFFLLLHFLHQPISTSLFIFCWLLAVLGFAFLARQAWLGGTATKWLFLLACWSFLFAYASIADPLGILKGSAGTGNRYIFVTDLLISLMVLIRYLNQKKSAAGASSKLPYYLVVLIIIGGLIDSAGYWKKLQNTEPAWRPQIARWRADPATTIAVSPEWWPNRIVLGNHLPARGSSER
jgi:hypothetical protein